MLVVNYWGSSAEGWKSSFNVEEERLHALRLSFKTGLSTDSPPPTEILFRLRAILSHHPLSWVTPGEDVWLIDLDTLANTVPAEMRPAWLGGRIEMRPETTIQSSSLRSFKAFYQISQFLIYPGMPQKSAVIAVPPELFESATRFRREHLDSTRTVFLMTSFAPSDDRNRIEQALANCLQRHNLKLLRADQRQYHPEIWQNLRTYMHCAEMGIAIYDRIESDYPNANVTLEVGYMLAMGKQVLLLKDRTLRALNSDLAGFLYREFDTRNPEQSLPAQIDDWIASLPFMRDL